MEVWKRPCAQRTSASALRKARAEKKSSGQARNIADVDAESHDNDVDVENDAEWSSEDSLGDRVGPATATELQSADTFEYLSKLRESSGSAAASVHDQPKLREVFIDDDEGYTKLISNEDPEHLSTKSFPAQLSDFCEVDVYRSPLHKSREFTSQTNAFVSPNETVLTDIIAHSRHSTLSREFARAGPRELVMHRASKVRAAIVTCGGLCPGLNTVIREIYMALTNLYGVKEVYGVPYGFSGFYNPTFRITRLTEELVTQVHHEGGSCLGSSRGGHNTKMICDAIMDFDFNQVYIIGGDGSHRGAIKLFEELKRRRLPISIIGVPKTIDNDIAFIDRSFGFDTAVEEAQRAIKSAKTEAQSALNGIGLVKLMGRHSGHITMFSVLASREVDVCLIPEVKFSLEGPSGLNEYLKRLLQTKGHAVVVVAEGAGEELIQTDEKPQMDASGNKRLPDIGLWLKNRINAYFKEQNVELNLKYIDPMYMIRSVPPNASDNLYCSVLGQMAVHGGFAGYTGFTVGLVNSFYVYIPMHEISGGRVQVDVSSRMWHRVIMSTGQPQLH